MRKFLGLLVIPILLGMTLSACGSGGAQTLVRVRVDGTNLSAEDRARVRSIALTFDGNGDAAVAPAVYFVPGLPTGTFETVIQPRITRGVLTISASLNDAAGAVVATTTVKVTVKQGNQVIATLAVGGPGDDAGTLPPVQDAAVDPDTDTGVANDVVGDATLSDAPPLDLSALDVGSDCNAQACGGAVADGCCPAACTAANDMDCAGCGNGKLDPGETCDPRDLCPTVCPQMTCQMFTLAQAGTCQAACVGAGLQMKCINADGCCPPGCTSTTDSDCVASCGNGTVEGQELCDGTCPSKCDPMGCQLRTLQGSPTTCDARCVNGAMQTACVSGDGCCPSGCDVASDQDCGLKCGNGVIEAGELCDGNCPTDCKPVGCQLRVLQGGSTTCDANCVNAALQSTCANGDGCCPAGCTSLNDTDCKPSCGNGVVEMGEVCDPPSACATIVSACTSDLNNIATLSGAAAACTSVCKRVARACGPVDTFCPTAVSCGPTSDIDCPGCGNSKLETGEACDPPSVCVTQMAGCVSDANKVATSSGSTTMCTYRCTTVARLCGPADGFCPSGCGPTLDIDCPGCGNGRLETGETCDKAPAAVTCASLTCDDSNTCTTDARTGSDAACNVMCSHTNIMTCVSGDRCCPMGCNANNDTDCAAVCGNGAIEGAETCEKTGTASPQCASITCNDGKACTMDLRNGADATCNVTCSNPTITLCVSGDGCCPGGGFGTCKAANDSDCPQVCGNGAKEGTETCDTAPASPTCASLTCDDANACTTDTRSGSDTACNVKCTNTPITKCINVADGCCPPGCNATNDGDCPAVCGNGALESGELCEISAVVSNCPNGCACPTMATCVQVGCDIPALLNAGTCQAECKQQGTKQTTCIDKDGCCPAGCTDYNDTDCPTPNDTCAGATDISKGGDFPFSLITAKQDNAAPCSPAGADVFFTFTLATQEAVYLDVYDAKADARGVSVDVALELWLGSCPPPTSQLLDCDASEGGKTCNNGKTSWPRIFETKTDNTTYTVVARSTNAKTAGRYMLRFQHAPLACMAGGVLPLGKPVTASTCQDTDLITTCRSSPGIDKMYYLEKCPGLALSVDTCDQATGKSDTALQVHMGSLDLVNRRCVLATGKTACDDDYPTGMTCSNASNKASTLSNLGASEHGLFLVTVESVANPAGACGSFGLTAILK